jgi:hypothetical protein
MWQPLQLRRVLLVAAALMLALGQGSTRAATPAGGTISSTQLSTTWQGQFYERAQTLDPILCTSQVLDPTNMICDHFQLTVQTAGTAQVTINWPSPNCQTNPTNLLHVPCASADLNDFDVYVYDSNGVLVESSANTGPGPETTAAFAVTPGTYEVRVIPFDVTLSDYQGTATLAPTAGGGGGQGGGLDPPISISNARVMEGNAGLTNAVFTLTMPQPTISPVTVDYVTADPTTTQTFTAKAGTDYIPQAGTAVFAPGTTRTTISVPVVGNMIPEPDKTFIVRLLLPSPPGVVAKIADPQGIGTIVNDDWGRSVRGWGRIGNVLTGEGTFSLRVVEWGPRGKLTFRQGATRFYSSGLTSISFNDLNHSATIQGTGWNAGRSVTFVLEVADNGVGTLDGFVLTLSDGTRATGPLTSGDIQYRG